MSSGEVGPAAAETAHLPCDRVALYGGGRTVEQVCAEAPGEDVVVLELGDDWTPLMFSDTPDRPLAYRSTFLALANERLESEAGLRTARRDRYFELFGVFPTFGVIRRRLLDSERHACHAAIDDDPLKILSRTLAPGLSASGDGSARSAAIRAAQAHLSCEGLLAPGAREGVFDAPTQEAIALYQRRHMIPSRPVLDRETREAMLLPSLELDFRTLLRALRERVADAASVIEDGSAAAAWTPILGRFVDSPEYRPALRAQPLSGAAPDRVDPAAEAAAVALGWTSPEAAVEALRGGVPPRAAVRLPAPPPYAGHVSGIRVEIDRGDVWTSYPLNAEGRRRPSPAKNRPTLTVFAATAEGEVPLVRWPTTIGAWKEEKLPDESVALKYKPSPVGRVYWRDLLVAPVWFPPPTTPDRELMQRRGPEQWGADDDAIGPGYRSAYGLMALLHMRATDEGGTADSLSDLAIRTHGSGNYRSILRGSSHGCHRLFNHLAIRLASYLLAHHGFERQGQVAGTYARTLRWREHVVRVRREGRGYRYELQPPITVDVLPGRSVRSRRLPAAAPAELIVTPPG
ncbi:MAG TPA: peptidoglycan-binding protein [Polyangia bacterium]